MLSSLGSSHRVFFGFLVGTTMLTGNDQTMAMMLLMTGAMAKFLIVAQENGIHVRSSLQVYLCFYCFMVGLPCFHSHATLQPLYWDPYLKRELQKSRNPKISWGKRINDDRP